MDLGRSVDEDATMLLKGLIELLGRCTVMQLSEGSRVYFLLSDTGEWFISTELSPGQVSIHP